MIDSSPSSAESSFRELDEVFLQTQTRIWLGEVLNTRLDEDLHISDLLQDGEILYEVSKVVWNLLLTKCMELRHLRHKYGPFGSKKSSGRYRPYSNVDSFLKICKILGLSGIDLFSPSDVVERRDIRKVCICIRALSKKARSKQLSVPDFDVVIYSVLMPTDMVGVIRRSLESSQCTLSSSSSYSFKGSQTKLKKKNSYAPSNRDDDSSSEESDEAESRYMGENKFDYADGVNSDTESSPEAYSVSGQYRRQNVLESDVKCQCTEELKNRQRKSAALSEAIGSLPPQSLENDHELDKMSSCCVISHGCGKGTADVSSFRASLENDDSVVGDSSCINVGESNYISDYLAFSDLMVHATDGSNRAILDGENNMFDFFLNVDSEGLNSDKRSFKNGSHRKFSDDEDMEVSSTTSMSSVLGRLLNLEFDDQFDDDDTMSTNVCYSASKEHESEKHYKHSFVKSESPNVGTFETELSGSTKYVHPSQCEREPCAAQPNRENDFCLENKDVGVADDNQDSDVMHYQENNVTQGTSSVVSDKTNIHSSMSQENLSVTISDDNPRIPVNGMIRADVDADKANGIQDSIRSAVENGGQDKREHNLVIVKKSISDEEKHTSPRLPPAKHSRKPLLKTVIKGTAIAGVVFLLLHISRKSKGNNAQENKQQTQVLKYSGSKPSSTKQQRGNTGKGVYPAEKIKL